MTVTIEDPLWADMRKHNEVRWSSVMKEAVRNKLKALEVLKRLESSSMLSEKDINEFAVKLGRKITNRK